MQIIPLSSTHHSATLHGRKGGEEEEEEGRWQNQDLIYRPQQWAEEEEGHPTTCTVRTCV